MRPARADELADRGVVHEYLVLYPSGESFRIRGVYGAAVVEAESAPTIRDGTRLFVLDPRAVVTRDGLIIHDPRRRPVAAWVRDWLDAHPEWPQLATETP